MEITAALAEQLRRLCDDPAAGGRLAAGLSALGRDVLNAVPTCLAVTLLLGHFGGEVSLSMVAATTKNSPVLASLAVPLADQHQEGATLILRAGQAGAFLLLADDLRGRLGDTDRPPIQVDQHLAMPAAATGESLATSLAEFGAVNQGIGVLIARGLPPEAARRELQRRASAAGVTLAVASRRLLASPRPWAGPGPP